ncbi:hypothetical protein ACFSMW_10180 [Virgibacillus halophilus]|uniref:Citrate transporter-like domain-containing protein n=1 Tax=Tigheibacillus halophilus TaxID=361280 RepID=A0ABU5C5W1_9BACI|nr:hypothetical protein [Virgibacillus halophilus]
MIRPRFVNYLYIYYAFVFVLHIMNVFLENSSLNYFIGVFGLLMLLVSFPLAPRLFQILGACFIIAGGFLFASSGMSVWETPAILTSNMSLLTLLAMLPWMNSVVKAGRFDRLLHSLLQANVKNLGTLYPRSTITMLFLTAFLNLSAATIAQDVLKDNLKRVKKKLGDSFIMMSTLRGYSLALLWSPLEILLITSIFITGVDFVTLLPWTLLISIIVFAIDACWGWRYFKKFPYQADKVAVTLEKTGQGMETQEAASIPSGDENVFYGEKKVSVSKSKIRKMTVLLISLVLFLLSVILLANGFGLDFIFAVTIAIFPFSFIWALLMKRGRSFWIIGWNTWKDKTNTMQNFIVLFVTMAFFSNSLNASPMLEMLQKPIVMVADYPLLIMIFILLFFIVLSILGVHPLATMGIFGGISGVLLQVMSPLSLAIMLACSAIGIIPIGTYGLVVTITAVNTGASPYKITWYNLPYSLMFGAISIFFAYLLL